MTPHRHPAATALVLAVAVLLGACAGRVPQGPPPKVAAADEATRLRWLDRVTWGANASSEAQLERQGVLSSAGMPFRAACAMAMPTAPAGRAW